jgi:hypothetical protein
MVLLCVAVLINVIVDEEIGLDDRGHPILKRINQLLQKEKNGSI